MDTTPRYNKTIRRISVLGGPGSGKSSQASGLYFLLKTRRESVELVNEHVKNWAYENKKPEFFDQQFFFGMQMQAEYHYLKNKVQLVVTDSPVILAAIYAELISGFEAARPMYELCRNYELEFPAANMFLSRQSGVTRYDEEGRFQDEKEAEEIDKLILQRSKEWLPHPVVHVGRDHIKMLMVYYNMAEQCPLPRI